VTPRQCTASNNQSPLLLPVRAHLVGSRASSHPGFGRPRPHPVPPPRPHRSHLAQRQNRPGRRGQAGTSLPPELRPPRSTAGACHGFLVTSVADNAAVRPALGSGRSRRDRTGREASTGERHTACPLRFEQLGSGSHGLSGQIVHMGHVDVQDHRCSARSGRRVRRVGVAQHEGGALHTDLSVRDGSTSLLSRNSCDAPNAPAQKWIAAAASLTTMCGITAHL